MYSVLNLVTVKEMKKTGLIILCVISISALFLIFFIKEKNPINTGTPISENSISQINEIPGNNSFENGAVPISANTGQNEIKQATIIFDGKTISVNGEGAEVSDNKVTIYSAGTFTLSGTLEDGQLIIDTEASEPVELIFNNVSLNSSNTSPLYVANADEVIINLQNNTENYVIDGSDYILEEGTDEPNAAIFSKDDLTIEGEGKLIVEGNYNDGIGIKDKLKIKSGIITVNAVDDGIRGKDKLTIKNGTITVQADGDGLKSDNDVDADKGNIKIEDGLITITSKGDAIQAASNIEIEGGEFNLNTSGGRNSAGSAVSSKGINAGDSLIISGETFTINSFDDAVHSNNYLSIASGTFTINTNDDGIHAETLLVINGGNINIESSYEGLESMVVRINGGEISLNSSDDGFSIASGGGGGWGGRGGNSGNNFLYINGGYIHINSFGDGIDANGSVEMTDGTLLVSGPTMSMNGALDYDGSFIISGGLIVAAGSSGMAMIPSASSTQNSVLVYLSSTQDAGTTFNLQSANGKNIISYIPPKYYQSVAISSPDLVNGETYDVYVGGNASGQSKDGLYEDGQYSPGTKLESFTVDNAYTIVGSGGGSGGGFRGGGGRR